MKVAMAFLGLAALAGCEYVQLDWIWTPEPEPTKRAPSAAPAAKPATPQAEPEYKPPDFPFFDEKADEQLPVGPEPYRQQSSNYQPWPYSYFPYMGNTYFPGYFNQRFHIVQDHFHSTGSLTNTFVPYPWFYWVGGGNTVEHVHRP